MSILKSAQVNVEAWIIGMCFHLPGDLRCLSFLISSSNVHQGAGKMRTVMLYIEFEQDILYSNENQLGFFRCLTAPWVVQNSSW
jgi:hypothetical protein